MHLKKTDFYALILALLCTYSAKAQVYLNPFSQYGLGEIQTMNQVNDKGMGGTFYTQTDANRYNFANPATYSNISYFSFEIGGTSDFYHHSDGQTNFTNFDPGVSYVSFAFPIDTAKRWGFSAGIMPYAKIGYQFQTLSVQNGINESLYSTGDGGLNRFYLGSSIRLFHNFYLGANASLIFGSEQSTLTQTFPDSGTLYGAHQTANNLTAGLLFDVGFTYNINFNLPYKSKNPDMVNYYGLLKDSLSRLEKNNNKAAYNASANMQNARIDSLIRKISNVKDSIRITETTKKRGYTLQIGGACNLPANLPTTQTIDAYTYSSDLSVSDSLAHYVNQSGYINMPLGLGGSIELASEQNWKIVASAEYRQWSKFRGLVGTLDSLNDYYSFGLGAQVTPRRESGNNLWTTTNYRIGFRYSQLPYIVNGNKVNEMGFSIGAGIPIGTQKVRLLNRYAEDKPKNWPYLDVALEFGQEGSMQLNHLEQQYVMLSFGFHIFEVNWFQKHKID